MKVRSATCNRFISLYLDHHPSSDQDEKAMCNKIPGTRYKVYDYTRIKADDRSAEDGKAHHVIYIT
jgi:hypothetical protein